MKKIFLFSSTLLLSIILIFGVHIAQAKPIKLLFATWEPPSGFFVEGIKAFAKDLETRTNGQVTVELSWAQSLGKIPEYYDLVSRGLCDAGFCVPFHAKGLFPLSEITTVPFKLPTAEITTKALFSLYKKGYLDKAFDQGVKPLFIAGANGNALFTAKESVTNLADLKGMKIRSSGAAGNAMVGALGAVPVFIPGSESYTALEKGIVNGTIEGYGSISAWKTCEVLDYATEPRMGSVTFAFFMNEKSYSKLPEDIRAVIDEMSQDNKYGLISARAFDERTEKGKACFIDHDGKIVEWEPSALEEINTQFAPIWDKWVAEREEKGLPARKAVNAFYSSLEELGVKDPAFGFTPGK